MKIKPINVAVMRNKHLIVDLLLMNGAVFDYDEYEKSFANQYMNWKDVKKEVKEVIAKHKLFEKKVKIFNSIEKNTFQNKKINCELLNL